ncbi:hypothetical protein CC78DRAFT_380220 [Lojkania enalia]|uniref:Uncharacterized protein n=1 Tax=Lojkania enalia TaxID=147567 RepID=A0A9P4K306_9PLEO|nr:hypothetical protein CC78DRAFT_380220 [Didymosphaeria enalia]
MTNPIYAPFLTRLKPLLSGDVSLYHIAPTHGPLSTPFAAPVTECLSLYLPASYPSSTYNDNFTNFKRGGEETGKDIIGGITGGWSIEPHEHDSVGKDAKLFAAFIGWPSVQAHMAYRETEEFPSVAKYLRDGPKGVKVCHVEFRKF